MARCKCQICKAELDSKKAFKVTDKKGKNKYFCSQSEFEEEEARKKKAKEDKDKVYYLICDMFGYEIQNTKFFDEWTQWNKLKSNEIIYKYLRENESYLQQICDRSFDTEYQRIRYFSAVLKNSLRDFRPKVEVVEATEDFSKTHIAIDQTFEIYSGQTNVTNRRRSFDEME
jgi:YHS domain-containing protein